jgi:hypothetical protein
MNWKRVEFRGEIKETHTYLKLASGNATFGESAINNCNVPLEVNNCNLTVNTTNLMSSGVIRSTWDSTITINTDDAVRGNPDLNPRSLFIFNFNGNIDLGVFELEAGGDGTRVIVLNLGADVEYLTFEDTSAEDWGDETLQINDFRSGIIRFGTDQNGLTDVQLAKITADGAGEDGVELDANGYLVPLQPSGTIIMIK